jgi:hypothetical protein
MAADRCLILYGHSVFLAGIQAMLADRLASDVGAPLQLITVDARQPDAAALIRARRPQAVLFDLAEGLPDFIAATMREQPDLLLIGVDPSCDEALVLSAKPQRALSVADLVSVICQKDSNTETFKGRAHEKNYRR